MSGGGNCFTYLRGVYDVNAYGVEFTPLGGGVCFVRASIDGLELEGVVSSDRVRDMRPSDLF